MGDLTVLVVDDESRMRKLIRDFLIQKNFNILEAEDGERALKVYEENKESLMSNLASHVQNGDTILVKASHFMQFDDVVKALENM